MCTGLAFAVALASRGLAQEPDTVTAADLVIAGVPHTADSNAVLRTLGTAQRAYRDAKPSDDGIRETHWIYPDLRIAFDTNGYITTIDVTGPQYVTARNIKLGASIRDVRRAYGNHPGVSDRGHLLYALSNSDFESVGISFFFTKGLLTRIIVGEVISVE